MTTGDRVRELLEVQTRSIARMTGSTLARCPACGMLVPERLLAEHAKSYGDGEHAVVEVMSS